MWNVKKYEAVQIVSQIIFTITNKCTINITKVYITAVSVYIIYTATCFKISMSSSGSSTSAPC